VIEDEELILEGQIKHENISEPVDIKGIVDTGSGFSYLINAERYPNLPRRPVTGKRITVVMADNSHKEINAEIETDFTIFDTEGKEVQRLENVNFFCLPSNQEGRKQKLEAIIGRDLIRATKMKIKDGQQVTINQRTVYQHHGQNKVDKVRLIDIHWIDWQEFNPPPMDDADEEISEEDKKPLDITFQEDPTAPLGRPYVRIPWRNDARPELNYGSTSARDRRQTQRLTRSELTLYKQAVNTLLEGNFATQITADGASGRHFISVRPVFDEGRSTKCRLCLDARAINKYTRPGPPPTTTVLLAVLLFRKDHHVTTWDLTKAFWQIRYHEDESPWFSTIIQGAPLRFRSMIFGSNFSPAALQQTLDIIHKKALEHLQTQPEFPDEPTRPTDFPDTTQYVDDYHCRSNGSTEDHQKGARWTRWWLEKHGFPSTKVVSNIDPIPEETKYLGYMWHSHRDTIRNVVPTQKTIPNELTIKQITGIIGELFDPMGRTLRHMLSGRLLLREAFQQAREAKTPSDKLWAFQVNQQLRDRVQEWHLNTKLVQWELKRKCDLQTIYVFSDSSQTAQAYAVFDANLQFVFARGGLLSEKTTIPRGELMALHNAIQDTTKWPLTALGIKEIVYATDSSCTIQRLNRDPANYPVKEKRMLSAIKDATRQLAIPWSLRHIWGTHNLADVFTRPSHHIQMEDNINLQEVADLLNTAEHMTYHPEPPAIHDSILRMILRSDTRKTRVRTDDEQPNATEPERSPRHNEEDQVTTDPPLQEKQDDPIDLQTLISIHHGDGHNGIEATYKKLRNTGLGSTQLNPKALRREVKKYIGTCAVCQQLRAHRYIRTAIGNPEWTGNLTAIGPATILGIDITTIEAKRQTNYACCLVVTCIVTKWIRAVPLRTELADEVTDSIERLFQTTQYPRVVISDNGPCFKSKKFQLLAARRGFETCLLPPYASTYAGWIERSNLSIQEALKALIAQTPYKKWDELLPAATHIVNSRPYDLNDETGLCPLDLVYSGHAERNIQGYDDEELLKQANIAHLTRPSTSRTNELKTKLKEQNSKWLRKYEEIWRKKRSDCRAKILKYGRSKPLQELEPGSYARVFRPSTNKVGICWSEPRKITGKPSEATRHVERPDGTTSLEYIANLQPCSPLVETSPPECSVPEEQREK
jgi:transposase InsO family protein